nr:hypothetical protein K-LCC10_0111 [Kaumoebavirus]
MNDDVIGEIMGHCSWETHITFRMVSKKYNRCPRLRRRLKDAPWEFICVEYILPEEMLREYQDYVNWYYLSSYQKLSEGFIREFHDLVNWQSLSRAKIMSENLIRDFQERLDWYWVSLFQPLTVSMIEEFENLIVWDHFQDNDSVPWEVRKHYIALHNSPALS